MTYSSPVYSMCIASSNSKRGLSRPAQGLLSLCLLQKQEILFVTLESVRFRIRGKAWTGPYVSWTIFQQSALEGYKVVSPTHQPP